MGLSRPPRLPLPISFPKGTKPISFLSPFPPLAGEKQSLAAQGLKVKQRGGKTSQAAAAAPQSPLQAKQRPRQLLGDLNPGRWNFPLHGGYCPRERARPEEGLGSMELSPTARELLRAPLCATQLGWGEKATGVQPILPL